MASQSNFTGDDRIESGSKPKAPEKKELDLSGVHGIEQENIKRQNEAIDKARDAALAFQTANNVEKQQEPVDESKLVSSPDVDVHEVEKANIAHWGKAADAEKEFAAEVQKSGQKKNKTVQAQAEAASEADASVEAAKAAEKVTEIQQEAAAAEAPAKKSSSKK